MTLNPFIRRIQGLLFGTAYASDCDIKKVKKNVDDTFDAAEKWGFSPDSFGSNPKIKEVLMETLTGKGNITSKVILNSDEALDAGKRWIGDGYKEIDTGVFRSADGKRQFRIDNCSLAGSHQPGVPHIHFKTYRGTKRKFEANNHVPLKN